MAVIISDFLGPINWMRPLRAIAGRHEVLGIEVIDPRDVELPPESTIAVVIRNGQVLFPNGATVLEAGDEVVAFTRGVHEPRLRSLFFSEYEGR